jgi:hypothetical protein
MRPMGYVEASVTDYQSVLRNISEERRYHLLRCVSLKSRISTLLSDDVYTAELITKWEVCVCGVFKTFSQFTGFSFLAVVTSNDVTLKPK